MPDVEKIYRDQTGISHQAGLQSVYDAGLKDGIAQAKATAAAAPVSTRRAGDEEQKDAKGGKTKASEDTEGAATGSGG